MKNGLSDEFDDDEYLSSNGDRDGNMSNEEGKEELVNSWIINISENNGKNYCRACGAEVNIKEFPDSISRDAFKYFGLCLTCQWGLLWQNGGQF